MWIELVAQSTKPDLAHFRFGPQQPFSFAHRLLPQFDTEVQTTPHEENERGSYGSSEPVSPTKQAMGECRKYTHITGAHSPQQRPGECPYLKGDPREGMTHQGPANGSQQRASCKQRNEKNSVCAQRAGLPKKRKQGNGSPQIETEPCADLDCPEGGKTKVVALQHNRYSSPQVGRHRFRPPFKTLGSSQYPLRLRISRSIQKPVRLLFLS